MNPNENGVKPYVNFEIYDLYSDEVLFPDQLSEGMTVSIWRPRPSSPWSHYRTWRTLVWSAFHFLRVFANRDYQIMFFRHDGELVHRLMLVPRYFRWPFMADDDLQVVGIWTPPQHRGKGYAKSALRFALNSARKSGRNFWYASRPENTGSNAVCKALGFHHRGHGVRTESLGLRLLGTLSLSNKR